MISFHSRDRSTQKNFQLIVITHDMEFVDVLGQAGYTEHYYKVSKEVGYVEVCGLLILCTFCCTCLYILLTTLQNQFCYFNKGYLSCHSCICSAEISIVTEQWYLTDLVYLHM